MMDNLQRVDSQRVFYEAFKNRVIFQREYYMEPMAEFFRRIIPLHLGQPDIAYLVTPLCYGPDFPFIRQAHLM